MEEQKYYTTKEISELLKVSPVTITRKLQNGEIKGIRLGGRAGWRVEERGLQEYLGRTELPPSEFRRTTASKKVATAQKAVASKEAASRNVDEQLEAIRSLKKLHAQIRRGQGNKQTDSAIEELYRIREETFDE
ncbi:MAG: helix-turn-helix domain-containing protein [Syntrophothermus sp.]